ncbi:DNA double-strand break repair nuclease NurA [Anaerosphaera multitolerans]|uniref:DNA double-strand break repair nuclease NurA n=1 Tax=Anaerosphaera multitolerans TaxID=2487351 RepID=A0A437S5D2_9FIRM|nr:DNA double-strand break repair nuclease NurA [Anaerosphaera multitolerans]RVU54116.1 DNA double-strand break repair nuclease NurA [Anaerosphaera multitolerans]
MIEDIQREIENVNELLKEKYRDFFALPNEKFRIEILSKVGKISSLKKLSEEELKDFGAVVGVDGSTNRVGGAHPHYIDLFQALAKPTRGEDLYLNECYTPILGNLNKDENFEIENKNKMLAQIELDVAINCIEKQNPSFIMMDGGLVRYILEDNDRFKELVEICEEKEIILIGVIEDTKTNIISRANNLESSYFDRELLYGRLNIGECLEVDDAFNNKLEFGISSAFLRTSSFAAAMGMDILNSQKNYLKEAANLIYTLTPYNSRGIPLWLDIVDKEVRITDKLIKSMLEEYLDRDIYERFFVSERDRRSL